MRACPESGSYLYSSIRKCPSPITMAPSICPTSISGEKLSEQAVINDKERRNDNSCTKGCKLYCWQHSYQIRISMRKSMICWLYWYLLNSTYISNFYKRYYIAIVNDMLSDDNRFIITWLHSHIWCPFYVWCNFLSARRAQPQHRLLRTHQPPRYLLWSGTDTLLDWSDWERT